MRRAAPPPRRLSPPAPPPARLIRWCYFELLTASIVKDKSCLWDLNLHQEGAPITFNQCTLCLRTKGTRPPLTSPEQMATELREGVASGEIGFTSGADADVVIALYTKGFVGAFDTALQYISGITIFYMDLGWGTAEVPTLVAALEYAEAHCRPKDEEGEEDANMYLSFINNEFTDAEKARLRAAIPEGSTKFEINT